MSTRRARIKAVASLPARRKNVENTDSTNNESQQMQNIVTESLKSPRVTTSRNEEIKGKESTVIKIISPKIRQLADNGTNFTKCLQSSDKISSPTITKETSQKDEKSIIKTQKRSEKVSVISPTPIVEASTSVFVSPEMVRNSPGRGAHNHHIQSPIIPEKRTEVVPTFTSPKKLSGDAPISNKSNGTDTNAYILMGVMENVNKINHVQDKSKNIQNDIDSNPPSVPESVTDESVLDGIVPLRTTRNPPKSIDLLKNEIISENADVFFDPIVPLPSPSKVRPKLRPAPNLAPHRRNSIQGSASESEDESRRALLSGGAGPTPTPTRQRHDSQTSHSTQPSLPNKEVNRNRNDSVCSSVSQVTAQVPSASSPLKDKLSKSRRAEMSRRMAMRRRRDNVKRDALTMYDLIFYNPISNPIVPDADEIKAKEANAKTEAEQKVAVTANVNADEEDVDDPPEAAPVPQIKIGPDGRIILDEKSLVIKQSNNRKISTSIIREGAWNGSGGKYSRSTRTADWNEAETVRFYRALAAVGTDFTLMAPLFPGRARRELKLKFKKEERLNGSQVDKALRSHTAWDAARLQDEFVEERRHAAEQARAVRERLESGKREERERLRAAKEMRFRRSRGAKAVESIMQPGVNKTRTNEITTADEIIQRSIEAKKTRKTQKKLDLQTPESTAPPVPIPSLQQKVPISPIQKQTTLTLVNQSPKPQTASQTTDSVSLSRVNLKTSSAEPVPAYPVSTIPSNIETGSLVVLTVTDPKSPSKKMLQTYMSNSEGKLTPIALPTSLLNSVMGYVVKGTPKSNASGSSPQLTSPTCSVATQDSKTSVPTGPTVIQMCPTAAKRQRHSSYTITQL